MQIHAIKQHSPLATMPRFAKSRVMFIPGHVQQSLDFKRFQYHLARLQLEGVTGQQLLLQAEHEQHDFESSEPDPMLYGVDDLKAADFIRYIKAVIAARKHQQRDDEKPSAAVPWGPPEGISGDQGRSAVWHQKESFRSDLPHPEPSPGGITPPHLRPPAGEDVWSWLSRQPGMNPAQLDQLHQHSQQGPRRWNQ